MHAGSSENTTEAHAESNSSFQAAHNTLVELILSLWPHARDKLQCNRFQYSPIPFFIVTIATFIVNI